MDITHFILNYREKGLLAGDYGSYRTQISRRLLVLRRKLKHTSTKGRKYSAKELISIENVAGNHEFVHLLLLTAERAWAQAMHMKSTHSADAGTKAISGSTRRHIHSRLHKASKYAQHLVELLEIRPQSGATRDDLLEARAYYVSLRGAVEFEKNNWQNCLREFSESRLLYSALAKSGNTKRDDEFKDLLSTTIDPSIRYAAYQLKLPRTTSIDAVVARYVSRDKSEFVKEILKSDPDALDVGHPGRMKAASAEEQNVPRTIQWRSREVSLEDASTAQALAVVAAAESELSSFLSSAPDLDLRAKAAAYDQVLIPSQDAVDAIKTAIDELSGEGVPQSDQRMQALQITRTAVNYALIEWRIGRNRVLCGTQDGAILEDAIRKQPQKPRKDGKSRQKQKESTGRKLTRLRERVVLYDACLQSLDSAKGLPGVAADQSFVQELDTKRSYFAALRCLNIARSHVLRSNSKNALALFARALDQCPQSPSTTTTNSTRSVTTKLEVTSSHTSTLRDLVQGLVHRQHALVELHNLHDEMVKVGEEKAKTALPLIDRLHEYPVNGADLNNLVTYPPKLKLIPVKPLFFDFASNYIEYPSRRKGMDSARANEGTDGVTAKAEPKKEAKKGWFGFGR